MYQQETITKELHLQLSDEDLAQFELDAKETERLGHIGTHMDCYMEAPRYKEYVTDAVVVDCRNGLPADEYFNNLDIEGKALVLYFLTSCVVAHLAVPCWPSPTVLDLMPLSE